nr:hypothetical protein [Zoogloeaceae bacterium]
MRSTRRMVLALALLTGPGAAVHLHGADLALSFLKSPEGKPFAFLAAPIASDGLGGTVHIASRPDDPGLHAAVDRAIAALIRSGEHERTARKHFPFNIL